VVRTNFCLFVFSTAQSKLFEYCPFLFSMPEPMFHFLVAKGISATFDNDLFIAGLLRVATNNISDVEEGQHEVKTPSMTELVEVIFLFVVCFV
jgi:hypothetical protein